MRKGFLALLAAAVLVALVVPLAGSSLARTAKVTKTGGAKQDTYEPSADVHAKLNRRTAHFINTDSTSSGSIGRTSAVGTVKTWVGLDDIAGRFYTKNYKMRGRGRHIEVWVAYGKRTAFGKTGRGINFQGGDCRNGDRTRVTDAQVHYLIDAFDNHIYPTESGKNGVFSTAPGRDGHNSFLRRAFGLPRDYYAGDADDIVVLIDNVRDDQWYDKNNTQNFSYIAGFFSSSLNFFFDRNVMTIDGFDWLHRTGLNPPNEPVPGDNCASAPARPALYEGVFAHEYQHLLLSYRDPAEVTFLNEGLADTAIALTGFGTPDAPITDVHFDSHTQCFQGYLGVLTPANPNPREGGPENSLNQWGDQTFDHESEILCDYGAAYSFLLYLAGQYGDDILSFLHRDSDHQGFEAVQAALDDVGAGIDVAEAIDRWQAMMALDGVLDDGAALTGGTASQYQTNSLDASINWDTSDAFDTPGSPPNGGDFVRLRNGSSQYLNASQLNSVSFNGVSELPPLPLVWTTDDTPPPGTTGKAFYSTNQDNKNEIMTREVTIPTSSSTLEFDAAWDLETTFDFGYAQVSTDGGETWNSLACTDTQDDTSGDNVGPGYGEGFNGFDDTPTFQHQTCDLTGYSGTVALAFRYFSDSNTHGEGFWVDNIEIDNTPVTNGDGESLAGWQSLTQYNHTEVSDWTVQLLSYDTGHSQAHLTEIPLDGNFDGSLNQAQLNAALGTTADVVSAIVTYHDDTELVQQYACYDLTVNGVLQPGGCD